MKNPIRAQQYLETEQLKLAQEGKSNLRTISTKQKQVRKHPFHSIYGLFEK